MNQQQEPFEAICEALSTILKAQATTLKHAIAGWPNSKWLQVDGNMPSIFFVDISESSKNVVSRYAVHKTTANPDGTGFIFTEKLRLFTLLQISLLTNTPEDRAALGWAIKQYLVTNYRLPLADGEYITLKLKGDHKSEEPEDNFYQRDLTFEVICRVLDATLATKVSDLNKTITID